MNWEEYLGPQKETYFANAPAMEPTIRNPRPSDYDIPELMEPSRFQQASRSLIDWITDIYPGRATKDYLATGIGSPDIVGDLAGDFVGPIGKLAGMGKMAGLVSMGGKKYPQAFLHRDIELPELLYLSKLIEHGITSEKPMSFVAPNFPYTYTGHDRFGLIFNGTKKDIKQVWPFDAWTNGIPDKFYEQPNLWTQKWVNPEFRDIDLKTTDLNQLLLDLVGADMPGEVRAAYGPRNIKGVRLSPELLKEPSKGTTEALGFADKHGLDVFSWNPPRRPEENEQMISQLLQEQGLGNWMDKAIDIPGYGNRKVKVPEAGWGW